MAFGCSHSSRLVAPSPQDRVAVADGITRQSRTQAVGTFFLLLMSVVRSAWVRGEVPEISQRGISRNTRNQMSVPGGAVKTPTRVCARRSQR